MNFDLVNNNVVAWNNEERKKNKHCPHYFSLGHNRLLNSIRCKRKCMQNSDKNYVKKKYIKIYNIEFESAFFAWVKKIWCRLNSQEFSAWYFGSISHYTFNVNYIRKIRKTCNIERALQMKFLVLLFRIESPIIHYSKAQSSISVNKAINFGQFMSNLNWSRWIKKSYFSIFTSFKQ